MAPNFLSEDSLPTYLVFAGGVTTCFYLIYQWLLPKAIPGIPYNKVATKHIFGDIPSALKHMGETGQLFQWIMFQNVKLQSPITQVFMRPFARPWVVITDFREAQDILLRRTKEFDRSDFFGDVFHGAAPKNHISMKTDNPEFKQHRRWLQDLMTPGSLHQVAAPHIFNASEELILLWEEKLRLGEGHPFTAANDIYRTALDAVWSMVFGADSSTSTMTAQIQIHSSTSSLNLPKDPSIEAIMPNAAYPTAM